MSTAVVVLFNLHSLERDIFHVNFLLGDDLQGLQVSLQ
jgi:hypothetical protein